MITVLLVVVVGRSRSPSTSPSTSPSSSTSTTAPSSTAAPTSSPPTTTTTTTTTTLPPTTTTTTTLPPTTLPPTTLPPTTSPPTAPPTTRPPVTAPPTTVRPTTVPPTTSPASPAVAVWHGNQSSKRVALTFDAGADTGYAAEILDILAANHIHATFGITGRWAEANPALVRRMADEGHQIVNHTYDHKSFTGVSTGTAPLTRAQRLDELARGDAAIKAVTGRSTAPWFRPPFGDEDASVRSDIALGGYRYELMWTVDSLGWKGTPVATVVQRCIERAAPGAIYVFHVGSASTDHAALQDVIDGLRALGYAFATAAEIIT